MGSCQCRASWQRTEIIRVENGDKPSWKITKAIFLFNHVHTVQSVVQKNPKHHLNDVVTETHCRFLFLDQQYNSVAIQQPTGLATLAMEAHFSGQQVRRWCPPTPRRIEKVISLSDLFMALWLIQYAQLWFSAWAAGSSENTEATWLVLWGGIYEFSTCQEAELQPQRRLKIQGATPETYDPLTIVPKAN